MRRNYYDLLGISPKATAEEVKKAYRSKAKTSHPDVNPKPGAAEEFVLIAEAFEILSDPSKRAVYDNRLRRDRIPPTRPGNSRSAAQARQQQRYEAWVRQARAQAQANARMSYEDFKKRSKLEQAELEVYHYMQYLLIGVVFFIAVMLLAFPFIAMIRFRWWLIFLSLPIAPVSFKLIAECRKGFKILNS